MASAKVCKIPNCGKTRHGNNWCSNHYRRWRLYGDPLGGAPTPAPLRSRNAFLEEAIQYKGDECLFWPYGNGRHYIGVTVNGKRERIHRLVCLAVNGEPPEPRMEAAHSCGKPSCCNPRHLRWATFKENNADRLEHGTANRGPKHGMSKLTEEDVYQIRALKGRFTLRVIGEKFGISESNVSQILRRKSWGWLP